MKYNDEDTQNIVKEEIRHNVLSNINYEQHTILGLDLLGYNKFDLERQTIVPLVFDLIYQETISATVNYEGCFFEGYSFSENFISTGDGCFQIFADPIQAFVFNINFYVTLHTYNSFRFYKNFRVFTGELFYRSCMTTGKIFSYENNYYGPGIIKNARIINRDRLNRFLIDEDTYRWFLEKIDGIENFSEIDLEDLLSILDIYPDWGRTSIFRTYVTHRTTKENKYGREYGKIKNCHVQKIGNILEKSDIFSIYSFWGKYPASWGG